MKFEEPQKVPGKGEGQSLYIRLKDGESVAFTPRGELYKFWSVFGQKGEAEASNPEAREKFKLNAVVNVDGKLQAKILEFGKSVYEQFYMASKFGDVTVMKFQLSRTGSTKETTKYSLAPLGPVPQPQLKAMDALKLNSFGERSPDQDFPPQSFASEMPPPDIPDIDELPF